MIAGGRIQEPDATARLMYSCDVNGLTAEDGEAAVLATIRSGYSWAGVSVTW
jgi:hypothetical protein